MKKLIISLIVLFSASLLSACGNLTVITRDLLLDEAEAPLEAAVATHPTLSASVPDGSASSVSSGQEFSNTPLYESCSYFLPALSERERTIFLALYEGAMAFQESIPLPAYASSDEIKDLMSFLCSECPELLQLDSAWSQRSNLLDCVTSVSPSYTMDRETYLAQRSAVEALLSRFHTQLEGSDSYQTELALFDYIISNCVYSLDADNSQNAYGALIGGAAKCDGRAKALVWGLRSFGITSSVITGSNHAWVLVQIGGYNYNVDPTYDDNEADGRQTPCSYAHFNVPESAIASDPYPADELFTRRGYPATVHWDSNYHVRSGLWIASGQDPYSLFLSQLQAAAAAGSGTINIRFETAEDYAAALAASESWIQSYLNQQGKNCSITVYDYGSMNTLFLEISF